MNHYLVKMGSVFRVNGCVCQDLLLYLVAERVKPTTWMTLLSTTLSSPYSTGYYY